MAEELRSGLPRKNSIWWWKKALELQADHTLFVWQLLLLKSVIVQLETRHFPIALGTFEFGALFYISSTLEHFLDL